MIKQVLFILSAGLALGDPIAVSTSGQFWLDNFMDGNALVSLHGSNATGSVSFGGDIPLGFTPPTGGFGASSLQAPWMQSYQATVDGITSGFWSVWLSPGDVGYVQVFDSTGNMLAEEDITSTPIQLTNYWEFGTRWLPNGTLNLNWQVRGSFNNAPVANGDDAPLSQVPEPGSGLFAGLGLAGLVAARFRR